MTSYTRTQSPSSSPSLSCGSAGKSLAVTLPLTGVINKTGKPLRTTAGSRAGRCLRSSSQDSLTDFLLRNYLPAGRSLARAPGEMKRAKGKAVPGLNITFILYLSSRTAKRRKRRPARARERRRRRPLVRINYARLRLICAVTKEKRRRRALTRPVSRFLSQLSLFVRASGASLIKSDSR